jgi:hypothetical protein
MTKHTITIVLARSWARIPLACSRMSLTKLRLLVVAVFAYVVMKLMRTKKKFVRAASTNEEGFSHGKLDIRRKAQIGFAQVRGVWFLCAAAQASRFQSEPVTVLCAPRSQAADYGRVGVVVAPNETFDLNKTIFASVSSPLTRAVLQKKLAVTLNWNDHFIDDVHEAMARIPDPVPVSSDIFDFMRDQCDFSCEHAASATTTARLTSKGRAHGSCFCTQSWGSARTSSRWRQSHPEHSAQPHFGNLTTALPNAVLRPKRHRRSRHWSIPTR